MQNLIMTTMAMVAESTTRDSAMNEVAGKIGQIIEAEQDQAEAIDKLADLAMSLIDIDREKTERTPETDARSYAWHLVHACIGMIKASNNVKLPYFPTHALEAIADLLGEKVQEVSSNQSSTTRRFYTEDCSERNWNAMHHLIDLNTGTGKNYMTLNIHQFSRSSEDTGTVNLACNEVEELLAVALRARLEEAKEQYENLKPKLGSQIYAKGDDFDPFLDNDDLP